MHGRSLRQKVFDLKRTSTVIIKTAEARKAPRKNCGRVFLRLKFFLREGCLEGVCGTGIKTAEARKAPRKNCGRVFLRLKFFLREGCLEGVCGTRIGELE